MSFQNFLLNFFYWWRVYAKDMKAMIRLNKNLSPSD